MLTFYLWGCSIAFILALYQACKEHNAGENIEDLPNALLVMTFMSWIYIVYFIIRFYKENK